MWMRRLDHSMIFVLIAGTATPIAMLVLENPLRTVLLAVAWGGAAAGVALSMLWPMAPEVGQRRGVPRGRLGGRDGDPVGWPATPGPRSRCWPPAACSTRSARSSTRCGRPDPAPKVFGYHEVFHALVVVAAALHFAAVGIVVL